MQKILKIMLSMSGRGATYEELKHSVEILNHLLDDKLTYDDLSFVSEMSHKYYDVKGGDIFDQH